jgi:hypothetical protein
MRHDIVPGAVFPDYALPDHTEKVRKLSELQVRLRGGAHSLALTFLRLNSLLIGKNTGILRNFDVQIGPASLCAAHFYGESAPLSSSPIRELAGRIWEYIFCFDRRTRNVFSLIAMIPRDTNLAKWSYDQMGRP